MAAITDDHDRARRRHRWHPGSHGGVYLSLFLKRVRIPLIGFREVIDFVLFLHKCLDSPYSR